MKKLTLLSTLIMSGLLVACGGSDPSNKPDSLFPEGYVPAPPPIAGSDDSIVNTPLPLFENFNDAVDIGAFFSAAYKPLATVNEDDPAPSFYYPTCCLYDDDGNVQENSFWISETEDKKLRFGNARFTIGQTLSALAGDASDPKINTTSAQVTDSWGELDLSRPYKVSFCVVQTGGAENMLIFVDNNTSSEANSKWGGGTGGSPIFKQNVDSLIPGKRVTINVPGETKFSPESASVLTINNQVGEKNSFLQVRVGSGGYAIIDDFLIEYQDETSIEPAAETCVADPNLQAPPPKTAPAAPSAPTLIVGDAQLTVTWSVVSGAANYEVYYNTIDSAEGATPFAGNPVTSTSAVLTDLINDTPYYVFVRAINFIGASDYSESKTATPVEPTATDADYTWGFSPVAYQAVTDFFTTVYDASGTNTVTNSKTVHEVDNLLIFLNDGTALRFRGNSNVWNFNGYSWDGANNLVPAIGDAAPALRAYIGIPVDSGREATLSITYKQTSSSVSSGKIVLIGSDNTILATQDALEGTEVIEYTAPEGHALTHIKIIYSREGAGGGGIDIGPVTKTYTGASNPGLDWEWLLDSGSYSNYTNEPDFLAPEASGNRAVNQADPAKLVNGLSFFKTDTGASIRFRDASGIINFNGSSFTSSARTINADIDGKLDQLLRNYVGVFVTPGEAVTVSFTWKQTSGTVDPSKIGLIDDTNTLLQQENAINGADGVISVSLPASHTSSEVRFFYSRENNTSNNENATGGIDLTAISRLYD